VEVTIGSGEIINRLKPSAIMGEFGLFEGGKRSATVMSTVPSTLLRFDGERLTELMERQPRLGMVLFRNLGRILCGRLRSTNIQIERLVSAL